MTNIFKYTHKHKQTLIKFMEGLQDYLVSVDSLKRLSRPKGYGKKYVNNLIKIVKNNNGVIFLAKQKGQAIGCIAGIVDNIPLGEALGHKTKHKSARVLELYVSPAFRGKKIGAFLMKKIEEYFLAKQCEQIKVEVYAPNKIAHKFYQKQGYKDESIDLVKNLVLFDKI